MSWVFIFLNLLKTSSGEYLSIKASGVNFCHIPYFDMLIHSSMRLMYIISIMTVITYAQKSSDDEVKANAWCLWDVEKKKHWRWMAFPTQEKLQFWLQLYYLVCYSFEPTTKRSSKCIFPPVFKPSIWKAKKYTLIWSPKLSSLMQCHVNQLFVIIA